MKPVSILMVLLFVFSIGCTKKKYPESVTENTPVFYMKARINNVDYTYDAGVDGYTMFSSYTQDSNGIYNFIADLKRSGCGANCPGSLKLQINDSKTSASNAPTDINSALSTRNYDFIMPLQYVQFSSRYNRSSVASYLWDFGDGSTSNQANPQHYYSIKGNYKVSLTIKDLFGCTSTIVNTHKIGYSDKITSAAISPKVVSGNFISLSSSLTGGTPPFRYLWNFGDGQSANTDTVAHQYKYAGSYPVTLRVVDATNDTIYANYNVVTQTDLSSCAANYSIAAVTSQVSNLNKALSQVFVTWTDDAGNVYQSGKLVQPSASSFQIVSVEDYDNNENGQKTKKIKVRFNCSLIHNSSIVKVENAELVLCVAYN